MSCSNFSLVYIPVIYRKFPHNVLSSNSKIELLLPVGQFLRIHRSYIVGLAHFKFLEGNFLKVGNTDLPIGATYKDALLEKLH
ncbi:MAG: LytTR family transcriptional regulator [Chitinophagaceae bacterium]|nr:MAG: LytTR family transcriptional regulator [Chitinophagaceae bacterium]